MKKSVSFLHIQCHFPLICALLPELYTSPLFKIKVIKMTLIVKKRVN